MAGFQSKMKLPIFGKFSGLNREFHSKNSYYFWNSKIQYYFKTAGIQVEGVSLLSAKLSVCRELRRIVGELQSEKSPRLLNSKNIDYFQAGSFTFVQNSGLF